MNTESTLIRGASMKMNTQSQMEVLRLLDIAELSVILDFLDAIFVWLTLT